MCVRCTETNLLEVSHISNLVQLNPAWLPHIMKPELYKFCITSILLHSFFSISLLACSSPLFIHTPLCNLFIIHHTPFLITHTWVFLLLFVSVALPVLLSTPDEALWVITFSLIQVLILCYKVVTLPDETQNRHVSSASTYRSCRMLCMA